jgi:hypothetical protein
MLTLAPPMTGCASYKIIPEHSLILEFLSGDICISDAIEMKMNETNDSKYHPDYCSIVSLGNINETDASIVEIFTYINILRSGVKVFKDKKCALLHSGERSALSRIYEMAAHELPSNFKIVNTLSEGLDWLGIDRNFENTIQNYYQSKIHFPN